LALFRGEAAQLVIGVGLHPASPIAQALGSYPPIAQVVQRVVHPEDGTAILGVSDARQMSNIIVAVWFTALQLANSRGFLWQNLIPVHLNLYNYLLLLPQISLH